ncbi:DUF1869 domain-containing protein [Shimwellia pseudoproteus]|uniref:DUF1869 domain-containing protein n=1 Tax=Shimwellia pseudoproteus TaxID=570012 RepID=UPI0018EC794D|nr:DUF1869 domain-containing protein [Shimwellia pseudoproteus]MBJ3814589.1 DUF1869 domain-containing protein [Shimwellia pseudoproteus]
MTSENQGYALAITNNRTHQVSENIYLKPMALLIPQQAMAAVNALLAVLTPESRNDDGVVMTVTNKNNGVSVDKDFTHLSQLNDPTVGADSVKDLINIVRGYESEEDANVCGW